MMGLSRGVHVRRNSYCSNSGYGQNDICCHQGHTQYFWFGSSRWIHNLFCVRDMSVNSITSLPAGIFSRTTSLEEL